MLCEPRLLSMTFGEVEELDSHPPEEAFHGPFGPPGVEAALPPGGVALVRHDPPQPVGSPGGRRASGDLHISPLQSLDVPRAGKMSPGIEIPAHSASGGDTPFLVPSLCQSFCKNYSDLHIGGDQVLPLSAGDAEPRVGGDPQASGPVPPPSEGSLMGRTPQGGPAHPLRGGSTRWRLGSGRDRSFLLQGREGPFSNSLLNHYLEQKISDLYQQYMMENMARDGSDSHTAPICPLLGSELVLTSLDQITLQLSREGNLEAGLAKDMVLSCLLRVASDMQSTEISTPFLQISNEASREQLADNKEE